MLPNIIPTDDINNTKGGGRNNTAPQSSNNGGNHLSSISRARHMLGLIGCCPSTELEDMFPSLARELLSNLRDGGHSEECIKARAVALAAIDESLRRLLHAATGDGKGEGGGGPRGNSKVGGVEVAGARQVFLS